MTDVEDTRAARLVGFIRSDLVTLGDLARDPATADQVTAERQELAQLDLLLKLVRSAVEEPVRPALRVVR